MLTLRLCINSNLNILHRSMEILSAILGHGDYLLLYFSGMMVSASVGIFSKPLCL